MAGRTTDPPPPSTPGDARLSPIVFSTDGVEPRHRRDLWLGKYDAFNRLEVPEPGAADFSARNEIWDLGEVAVLRNTGPALAFDRTARHIRRDSVDHWVIRLTRSGRSRLRTGEVAVATSPLTPILFSLGEPFAGDRTEADWVSLYIPRDSFPELSAGLARLGPRLLDTPSGRLLADYIEALHRRLPEMGPAEVPMLVQATRSMVAACLLSAIDPRAVAPEDAATAQFEVVRRIIRRNIASPTLGPERLSRLAGMSRSSLYRLFEPHGGVARYVQRLRLQMVHAALVDPVSAGLSIAAVAEGLGFYDPSAFSRMFRREFGYAPRELRAAAGVGLPPPPFAAGGGAQARVPPSQDFVGALRRLGAVARPAPTPAAFPTDAARC